jgi:hypothetical protein
VRGDSSRRPGELSRRQAPIQALVHRFSCTERAAALTHRVRQPISGEGLSWFPWPIHLPLPAPMCWSDWHARTHAYACVFPPTHTPAQLARQSCHSRPAPDAGFAAAAAQPRPAWRQARAQHACPQQALPPPLTGRPQAPVAGL